MLEVLQGRVWKFGDNISTDLMMPGFTLHGKVPKEKMKEYCMKANRPEFAGSVKRGDIMVAGKNCGCGSSRPAPDNLTGLGVSCVIADSCASIFFRNCIAVGLPAVEAMGVSRMFNEGDTARVDFKECTITNLTSGQVCSFTPYPREVMEIMKYGGVIGLLRNESCKVQSQNQGHRGPV